MATDLLRIFADDKRLVTYRPAWREICGTVTGAILMGQILYWWDKSGKKPFYKFKQPCENKLYRAGDSWCEELGFSRKAFDSAIKLIGEKTTPKAPSNPDSERFVFYWSDMSRLTWYDVNASVFSKALMGLYVTSQWDFMQSSNGAPEYRARILYTENNNKDYGKGQKTPSPLPLEDLKSLLPDGVNLTGQVKAKIEKAVFKGNKTIGQIREALAYTTAHCKDVGKYAGYFGKCLDYDHAAGFLEDCGTAAMEDQGKAIREQKAENLLLQMSERELTALSEEIEQSAAWPHQAKHELWAVGVLSPRIRERVLSWIARGIVEKVVE